MARVRSVIGVLGIVACVALALGCDSSSPTAPSATYESGAGEPAAGEQAATLLAEASGPGDVLPIASAPDGSTLKAAAPIAQSPIDEEEVDTLHPTLIVVDSRGTFVPSEFDYRFEVHARDSGSGPIGSGLASGSGRGNTWFSVGYTLLEEGTDYQWRARAEKDDRDGPWSSWAYFSTPTLSSIDAPLLEEPISGSTVTSLRPQLKVINGEISGNTGTVMYEFQIARDSAFTNIVETLTQTRGQLSSVRGAHLAEQHTSVKPSADLSVSTTYYWRARGTNEAATTVSDFTSAWSFTTPPAASSSGGSGDAFDLSTATFLHANVSGWPVTSTVTSVTIGNPPICIRHTKAGGWPVIQVSGTNVEGNAWVAFQVGGKWYAATWEYLRPGQTCKGLKGSDLGPHIKKSPGDSWSPKSGETVYFFVSTPARGNERSSNERSNVFRTTWP